MIYLQKKYFFRFQFLFKGHGQGQTLQIYGTDEKALSQGT